MKLKATLMGGLICAAAALATQGAQAGDIGPAPAEPVVTAPMPDWTGFYGGVSVGTVFGADDRVGHTNRFGRLLTSPGDLDLEGVNYGVRLGWRIQVPNFAPPAVFGVELGYDDGGSVDDGFATASHVAGSELEHVFGLRFKGGVTSQSRRTFFYGQLGYVRGDFDYGVVGSAGGDVLAFSRGFDTDGYALGLGVEHKLTERLSVLAEWEYLDFSKKRLFDADLSSTLATPDFHNLRIGMNFQF